MDKIIHILAGGPEELVPDLSIYKTETNILWIGVDRGVYRLLTLGIQPDMAFGDFDSVTSKELEIITEQSKSLRKYQPEKDETDMELALLWAIEQNPKEIKIFGATGGRADHYFANVMLLVRNECLSSTIKIEIHDKQNILSIFTPGTYTIDKLEDKKYVSFVPQSSVVEGITLLGFMYPLYEKKILKGSSLCISNELIQDSGTFSFTKGILMLVRSED